MIYLRFFENFNKVDEQGPIPKDWHISFRHLVSEIEPLLYILEDENHQIDMDLSGTNEICLNVIVHNFKKISNKVLDEYMQHDSKSGGEYFSDPQNFDPSIDIRDHIFELGIDRKIIKEICNLDEMVEFKDRLDDVCLKHSYQVFAIFYIVNGIQFYINKPVMGYRREDYAE